MARSRYEFIKIELRLFSNFKFLMWDDFTQNFYIKLIALAKQNNNKVKKDWSAINAWLRGDRQSRDGQETHKRSPRDIKETFERIVRDMGNIGQNRWEFWFKDWDERYSYHGVEKEKDIEKEKDEERTSKNKFLEGSGWIKPLKDKFKWNKDNKKD